MKKAIALLMTISVCTFVLAAVAMHIQADGDRRSASGFDTLRAEAQALAEAPEAMAILENTPVDFLPETDDPVVLSYREMARTHPDLVGWLTVEGTQIDYPVMRSPEEAERYLHRDYDGRYNRASTPFMLPISDPSVPNENIIIYAHHMKNGSMFGTLPVYETKEAYDAQPYIQFDTLYGRGQYKIIAVFRTSIGAEDEFSYYEYEWLDDEETFDRYMRGVMANRLYDTGETAVYGDPTSCFPCRRVTIMNPTAAWWWSPSL